MKKIYAFLIIMLSFFSLGTWADSSNAYEWEPTTKRTFNYEFDYADYYNYYDDYGCMYLYFENSNAWIETYVYAPLDTKTGIPLGTYDFASTAAENTVWVSRGRQSYYGESYDDPTYLGILNETEDDYTPYYLVSGTLTVEANDAGAKITINATSYNGSKINTIYIGAIKEYSYEDEEDAISPINTATSKDGKFLEKGQIRIRKGGKVYNAQGLLLR